MDKILFALQKWLSVRNARERQYLLLAGCICIYVAWELTLEKPLSMQRTQLHQQIKLLQIQMQQVDNETQVISRVIAENPVKYKNLKLSTEEMASSTEVSRLVKVILNQPENVKLLDLQEVPPSASNGTQSLQMKFHGNYFGVMNSLHRIEKLPWCLSWDSLDYKVISYPEAEVVVNLHIVAI